MVAELIRISLPCKAVLSNNMRKDFPFRSFLTDFAFRPTVYTDQPVTNFLADQRVQAHLTDFGHRPRARPLLTQKAERWRNRTFNNPRPDSGPLSHKLKSVCIKRLPTVITVVLLLFVWEAWVRLGHVPSTMIAAPSEIAQATVETWPTLWPATKVNVAGRLCRFPACRGRMRHFNWDSVVLLTYCECGAVPVTVGRRRCR